jgi:hypothetical protein
MRVVDEELRLVALLALFEDLGASDRQSRFMKSSMRLSSASASIGGWMYLALSAAAYCNTTHGSMGVSVAARMLSTNWV